jgi:hypothetical protein
MEFHSLTVARTDYQSCRPPLDGGDLGSTHNQFQFSVGTLWHEICSGESNRTFCFRLNCGCAVVGDRRPFGDLTLSRTAALTERIGQELSPRQTLQAQRNG